MEQTIRNKQYGTNNMGQTIKNKQNANKTE